MVKRAVGFLDYPGVGIVNHKTKIYTCSGRQLTFAARKNKGKQPALVGFVKRFHQGQVSQGTG
jgi:hypothetical protein